MAKETEIKNARIIMVGKINNISNISLEKGCGKLMYKVGGLVKIVF